MQLRKLEHAPLSGAVLQAYREFVGAAASSAPQARIARAISAIAPIDRFYVSERADPCQSPHLIAHRLEGDLAGRVGDYLQRFFLRDPIGRAMEAAHDDGAMCMLRVGPADIAETEYRRCFFDGAGIVERLSFVQRFTGRWLIMNVARRAPSRKFADDEIQAFAGLSQLLLPLAAREARIGGTPTVAELEARFEDHCPSLSLREREVCARTVIGMTSEATSLDLGIGIGSVQTYRKRAFQRLGICSAFQLAPLVMH